MLPLASVVTFVRVNAQSPLTVFVLVSRSNLLGDDPERVNLMTEVGTAASVRNESKSVLPFA